ncbi:hypothetical protein GCM10023200_25530 [Actinomycetospora chlora]|uniref:Anti-anti-sigma factor n=1 Tax=Actinomycetospora chlora TaxID=663608 RepID=A0ABP9B2Q9_9PSEU
MTPSAGEASFRLRTVYGAPRPVLVLTATGVVDRTNDVDLFDQLDRAATIAASSLHTDDHGWHTVAGAIVLDLRGVILFSSRTIRVLSRRRDVRGRPLRVVAADHSAVALQIEVLHLDGCFARYTDIADAVLADAA